MNLIPKEIRLGDSRTARILSNAPTYKKLRRKNSAMAVQQWKDLKKDKRFALPALAATYEKLGIYLSDHVNRALHVKQFAPHSAIPEFAYRFAAAHPAQCDAGKIACYPTFADAKRGREVVMTPGRFFAAVFPHAQPADVQRMAEKYACAVTPAKVHFGSDADDFARVYASARGFSSCMARDWDDDNGAKNNPVRFYAHPENDLAIAYLTHNNREDGETVARSIVNMEKKLYVRVYGDARLADLLRGLGYQHNAERALHNQKCRARTNKHGDLVAPYLDAIQRISWDGSSDTCRINSDGDYEAANTDGIATCDDERSTCDNCGDREDDDDDMNYSDYHDMHICQHCADRNFTYAIYDRRGNETYIRDDEVVRVGDQAYLDNSDVLAAHNCVMDEDGDWQDLDDCIYLEYRGEYVLISQCTELDIPFGDDTWARDCDLKTVHVDGEEKTVHEDWEDEDGITDEWKEENPEEDEDSDEDDAEDLGKFPAAHARPDDSAARLIATLNNEAGCVAAMVDGKNAIVSHWRDLDQICRDMTGFTSFADLLSAVNYRPTVDVSEPRLLVLANAYDAAQELRGDDRRAYRYGRPANIATNKKEAHA